MAPIRPPLHKAPLTFFPAREAPLLPPPLSDPTKETIQTIWAKCYFPQLSKPYKEEDFTQAREALSFGSRFTLGNVIGIGSFGVVIRATEQGQNLVIKVSRSWTYNESIQREAVNSKKLWDLDPAHTATPVAYRLLLLSQDPYDISAKRSCLVSTHEGENLYQLYLIKNKPLVLDQFISIAYQMLLFGNVLEENNYVLDDMSANNMVLSDHPLEPSSLKIIDTADLFQNETINMQPIRITLQYRCPSVLTGKNVTSQMLFSMGTVLFEIITGQCMFPNILPGRDPYVCMTRHLKRVFKLVSPPSKTFLSKIPDSIAEKFKYFEIKKGKMAFIKPFDADDDFSHEETPDFIQIKVSQRLEKITSDEAVTKDIIAFIHRLLNYNNPSSFKDLLSDPIFSRFSQITKVHLENKLQITPATEKAS